MHPLLRPLSILLFLAASTASLAQTNPAITSWLINTTNVKGRHYVKGSATPVQDTMLANVMLVRYSDNNVYIDANGIPAYVIGPYLDGNPSTAVGRKYLFKLPLAPRENTGTKTAVGLGHIGVLINGVPVYNYADARSYNNGGVWHQNAIHFERAGFDCAKGHPAPISMGPPSGGTTPGQYHHHQDPSAFNISKVVLSDVCDMYLADGLYVPDSTTHGPLIGYAFDGFPIYGAYGWVNVNGTNVVKRMVPSYQLRAITDRTTLPDGTVLTGAQVGPSLSTQPLGAYAEDFVFAPNSGDLDVHNGRFCVTPEYPQGTYAYFATIDANGNSAFPYMIGPTYYGVVTTENFPRQGPGATSPTQVVVNESVTTYVPNSTTPTVTFTSTPVTTGKTGSAYSYRATAQNNVGAPIVYSLTSSPTGMTIDATTGQVSWAQPVAGTHSVSIQATIMQGGKDHSATQSYALVITSTAPLTITFTSTPVDKGTVGRPYTYLAHATVSDTSKRLRYALRDSAVGMTIVQSTGAVSWTSPVIGTYPISIVAQVNGDTTKAVQSFTLTIVPDTTVSVNEDVRPLDVTVFPNPAHDVLVVQVTKPMTTSATIELIDLAGTTVRTAMIQQGSTMCYLDVRTIYSGSYTLRVAQDGRWWTVPVIVAE